MNILLWLFWWLLSVEEQSPEEPVLFDENDEMIFDDHDTF